MGSIPFSRRSTVAIAAAALALTVLAGVGNADARTVVHRAKVWDESVPPTYANGVVSMQFKLRSTHRRCIDQNAVSDVDAGFYFKPDPEYQTGDGPLNDYAFTGGHFAFKRVGLGHYRFDVPGSQTVATTMPDGSYGGTYSFERWVASVQPLYKLYIGSHIEAGTGEVTDDQKNWVSGPARYVVYYTRRNGTKTKHVVKCGRPIDLEDEDS